VTPGHRDPDSTDDEPRPAPAWDEVLAAARHDDGPSRVCDLLRVCETVITRAGLSGFNSMGSPRKDAQALVYETLAIRDHSDRFLDAVVTSVERAAILDLLERRVAGPIPVPYLTGQAFFAGRRFFVRAGVFIPRSALGYLLDEVLGAVAWSATPRLLEVGCGTGALGISIAVRAPGVHADLVDIDPLAVQVANENIARHGLADRVRSSVSDMYAGVDATARYDLIVANLPYVPDVQIGRTNREIEGEPQSAIYRPGDGLDHVRAVLADAALHLADTGLLVLEVGTFNRTGVQELVSGRGRWWTVGNQEAGVLSITRDELKA
jgi:ribosomal protein L3 glutamine methyltransferase